LYASPSLPNYLKPKEDLDSLRKCTTTSTTSASIVTKEVIREEKRYEKPEFGTGFSVRQLERYRQLYERLLLSNDKASVLAVARGEKTPENPSEIIKDPMVLEFLGLKRGHYFCFLARIYTIWALHTHVQYLLINSLSMAEQNLILNILTFNHPVKTDMLRFV
jgi:hypothetical protein